MRFRIIRLSLTIAFAATVGAFFSCTKQTVEEVPDSVKIDCVPEVFKSAVDHWANIVAPDGKSWTVSISYDEGTAGWAGFGDAKSPTADGTGESLVRLKFGANASGTDRSLYLICRSGSAADTSIFVQRCYDVRNKDTQDKVPAWMELPACNNSKLEYYNHDMTVGGKTYRNYSIYYDAENLISHWVAYPMWKSIMSSGGRTDAWGVYDPKISEARQQYLKSPYGRAGYDRGHQLPSHDRCIAGTANVQTFYGTNMTPQLSSLNQQGWAKLEGKVHGWTTSFDTLYIVTGCTVMDKTMTLTDNLGKQVAVPTSYYKALLGYVKEFNEYHSIAFYYPHEAYSGDCASKAMTVLQLQDKLANEHKESIDFFCNLPSSKKASIKSQDYTHWLSITK